MITRALFCAALMALVAATALGQVAEPILLPGLPIENIERASRLADAVDLPALAELSPASEGVADQLEALRLWNQSGTPPLKNGIIRSIPNRYISGASGAATASNMRGELLRIREDGAQVWTLRLRSRQAHRLRLHLENVILPAGTKVWVYNNQGEEVGPFGVELIGPDRDIWTPSVAGEVVSVELLVPPEAVDDPLHFEIRELLEIFWLDDQGTPHNGASPSHALGCLFDSRCATPTMLDIVDLYRSAVAHLQFFVPGGSAICTGALINDTDNSSHIPYVLTANHCLSSQDSASSLEAFWDYVAPFCGGPWPLLGSLPRSSGSTLLSTSVQTDFTFLRLNGIPAGRALLGWNADPAAALNGTILHRISHPLGFAQAYSRTVALTPAQICPTDAQGRPWGDLSRFIYSSPLTGAAFPGSSGAPSIVAGGFIVGQLLGGCGLFLDEPCIAGTALNQVDGRFSATYPSIAQWLNPTTSSETCIEDASTLCLNKGRFRVRANFETSLGQTGAAEVVRLTDETGYLWFFNASNVEAVVKVLDACALNSRFWVFAGGLTDVKTSITITDTRTGQTKTYNNPQGTPFQPIQDTSAFATCP